MMWFRNRKAIRSAQDTLAMHADAAMHRAVSAEVLLMTTAELVEFVKTGEKYSSIAAIELVRRADQHNAVTSLITIGEVS